jgi:hypothetical protein
MKVNMEHWWNETDRGKQKYWEGDLFHCLWVHHKSHRTVLGSNPVLSFSITKTNLLVLFR